MRVRRTPEWQALQVRPLRTHGAIALHERQREDGIMPKITDMEVRVTFTMDNGERVKTLINSDGSAMGWGASTEAVGETVDLREALAQVVYEAHVAREDGEAEPEAESLDLDSGK